MNNYEIIVYWSIEDRAFIAEVPELAGCIADSQTYIEAVKNAEIAIEDMDRNSAFHREGNSRS